MLAPSLWRVRLLTTIQAVENSHFDSDRDPEQYVPNVAGDERTAHEKPEFLFLAKSTC